MNKLNTLLSVVIKILTISVLIAIVIVLFQMKGILQETKLSITAGTSGIQSLTIEANKRFFGKGETADIVKATLLHVDRVAGETAILSRQEHIAAKDLNEKLIAVVEKTDNTIESLNTAIKNLTSDADKITEDMHVVLIAFNKDLEDLDPILINTRKAIVDLDENLINDPDIKESLKEIAEITRNINGITGNLNLMSADTEKKFHNLLTAKPTLKTKILLALKLAYQAALIKATIGF